MNSVKTALVVASLSILVACSSPEDRAERYYQQGIELLQKGDRSRAFVAFRNALKQVPGHRETMEIMAQTLEGEKRHGEAYRYRLQIAESAPEDGPAALAVAEAAIRLQDWENADRYGKRAIALLKDDRRADVVALVLDYRAAALAAGQNEVPVANDGAFLQRARALSAALPKSELTHALIVDILVRQRDFAAALTEASLLVENWPDRIDFHRNKLRILNELGDEEGLEGGLRAMVEAFPDDEESRSLLIRYYMSRGAPDKVEDFLRSRIKPGERDDVSRAMLVQFLRQTKGIEAAQAEVDTLIAENTSPMTFRMARAGLDFEAGQRDRAIAEMQDLIQTKDVPAEDMHKAKILLARFLGATGNTVGAQKQVDEVLAEDASYVDALQMRAAWMIEGDKVDEAVGVLRQALDQEPNDPLTLTLMAQAYLRNGDRQLAGDTLALAVQAANGRAAEAIRYARFLISDQKYLPAEDVLIDALRVAPNTPDLLVPLGEVYVRLEDWPRAEQVERNLRALNRSEMNEQADRLRVAILSGQQRNADAVSFLESQAQQDSADTAAQVAVLRAHMQNGAFDNARSYLDTLMQQHPDNQIYQVFDAALKNAMGDHAGAEERYRALIAERPEAERLRVELIRTLNAAGKRDEAKLALDEAMAVLPDGLDLNWIRASNLERDGDAEGAIAVYEKLYAINSGSTIIANNLASLLTTARSDPESLEQAWTVARRLRDADLPAFQDTYGWIAFRRGDLATARRSLDVASAGMPNDPLVTLHLGIVQAAQGETEAARATLERAITLAGARDDAAARGVAEDAQAELAKLPNVPEATPAAAPAPAPAPAGEPAAGTTPSANP